MARNFDLKKGEKFSLGKSDELSTIQVDLNWKSGADLDASAFLLNDDGVITEDADFVYTTSPISVLSLMIGLNLVAKRIGVIIQCLLVLTVLW
ncbi:TerD family protein [Phocaeicola dorei]|nr:TerD family protein [Phocaeicola dorei]